MSSPFGTPWRNPLIRLSRTTTGSPAVPRIVFLSKEKPLSKIRAAAYAISKAFVYPTEALVVQAVGGTGVSRDAAGLEIGHLAIIAGHGAFTRPHEIVRLRRRRIFRDDIAQSLQ